MKFSIIIPCYNESDNLLPLLEAYDEAITRDDVQVVLVNNGSSDTTADILKNLPQSYTRFLKIHTLAVNKGYGFGVISGLMVADGAFIGWTHGDLQTLPSDVLRACSIIEEKGSHSNLYVKGMRTGRPLFDRFFSYGMGLFETIYLRVWLQEINAQPNIFHRDFFATWENPPHDFALDLYALYLAKKQKLEVFRFPTAFPTRIHGSSKWDTGLSTKWKFIKRTISFSTKLKNTLYK